jgi:PAS domain S-box-containing protein
MVNHDINKLSREILSLAPDAILFADEKGIIRLWNRGAEMVFGFTAAEAIGQSLDLIIPERLRAVHWDGYHRVMASGETRYGKDLLSVPALHRDGHQLSCEFSIVMLQDETGKLIGIASIMRDVTDRWNREKALNEQIASLKAKHGD